MNLLNQVETEKESEFIGKVTVEHLVTDGNGEAVGGDSIIIACDYKNKLDIEKIKEYNLN